MENNKETTDTRTHEQYIECFNLLMTVAHGITEHDREEKTAGKETNPYTQLLLPHIHACMRFLLNYMDVRWKENGNANDGKRNYRHCGVHCCGTCRWFTRVYEETFCEHPKNVVDVIKDEYVAQPTDDMVCGWWEKKEGNDDAASAR